MSERRIKVVTRGEACWPGLYVADPDADYPMGELVPEADYLADEQDWQHVISRRGHADIGEVTLAGYDGSQSVSRGQDWMSPCWLLVDADGQPIEQDPTED